MMDHTITLPENQDEALTMLIALSERLLTLSEEESQAMIQANMSVFSAIQTEKEKVSRDYIKASEEFRVRFAEFKNADQNRMSQLEALQNQLNDKIRSNNQAVAHIFANKTISPQAALLAIQELAQQDTVKGV